MAELYCFEGFCLNSWHLWLTAMIFLGPIRYLVTEYLNKKKSANSVSATTSTPAKRIISPIPKVGPKGKSKPLPLPPMNDNIYMVSTPRHLRRLQDYSLEVGQHIVICFTATWCGPCKRMYPFFQVMSECYHAIFCSIDIDEYREIANDHEVKMVPSYMILGFEDNEWKCIDIMSGADSVSLNAMVRDNVARVEE